MKYQCVQEEDERICDRLNSVVPAVNDKLDVSCCEAIDTLVKVSLRIICARKNQVCIPPVLRGVSVHQDQPPYPPHIAPLLQPLVDDNGLETSTKMNRIRRRDWSQGSEREVICEYVEGKNKRVARDESK